MATESPTSERKVVVHLRATGDAPILKQAKFKVLFGSMKGNNQVFVLQNRPPLRCKGILPRTSDYIKARLSDSIALFVIAGTDKFSKVIEFLCRQLHRDTLFVYINSAFSPNPDELVIDLYNNFGFDGKLVVNYACSMAWG